MTQITPELRQQLLDQGFSAVTYPEQEGEFLIKWVEVRHLQDVFHDSHMEPDMAASIEACPNGMLRRSLSFGACQCLRERGTPSRTST